MAAGFKRKVAVLTAQKTLAARASALFAAYPLPLVLIAGVIVVAIVTREAFLVGFAFFPLMRLVWQNEKQRALNRKLGIVDGVIDLRGVPEVALVEVGPNGLSIEGMNHTLSHASFLRARLDELAGDDPQKVFIVGVETKRDLPTFEFSFASRDEALELVEALRHAPPAKTSAGVVASPLVIPESLKRGRRTLEEWVDALRGRIATDYRTPPLGPSELWSIVETEASPLEMRAAAAVALGPTLDKSGRKRFRAIKEDAPYLLRVVLKVAHGDDKAAIGKALAACRDA